jgi:hypothetical protein
MVSSGLNLCQNNFCKPEVKLVRNWLSWPLCAEAPWLLRASLPDADTVAQGAEIRNVSAWICLRPCLSFSVYSGYLCAASAC